MRIYKVTTNEQFKSLLRDSDHECFIITRDLASPVITPTLPVYRSGSLHETLLSRTQVQTLHHSFQVYDPSVVNKYFANLSASERVYADRYEDNQEIKNIVYNINLSFPKTSDHFPRLLNSGYLENFPYYFCNINQAMGKPMFWGALLGIGVLLATYSPTWLKGVGVASCIGALFTKNPENTVIIIFNILVAYTSYHFITSPNTISFVRDKPPTPIVIEEVVVEDIPLDDLELDTSLSLINTPTPRPLALTPIPTPHPTSQPELLRQDAISIQNPLHSPTELPLEIPVELLTELPAEVPVTMVKTPVELPIEIPVELPTEVPVTTVKTPVEIPVQVPITLVKTPVELPIETPVELHTEVPITLVKTPVELPVEVQPEPPVIFPLVFPVQASETKDEVKAITKLTPLGPRRYKSKN